MLSRRRSQVFSREGSMLRSRVSRLGASGLGEMAGSWESAEREVGKSRVFWEGGGCGRSCRKEVRRYELWIWSGSSMRMS